MLYLRTKTVLIDGRAIKLYSLDGGRLWFSRPHDVIEFRQRVRHDKAVVQTQFEHYLPAAYLPIATADDF